MITGLIVRKPDQDGPLHTWDSKTGFGQSAVERINKPVTQAISIELNLI